MSAIGNWVFQTTGILTKRGIMKRAGQIGNEIAATVAKEGNLTQKELNSIVEKNLGKYSERITCITEKDDFIKVMMDEQRMNKEQALELYETMNGINIAKLKERGVYVFVKPAEELTHGSFDVVETVSHELEHAMFCNHSLLHKVSNCLCSLLSKNNLEKIITENISLNGKLSYFQDKLYPALVLNGTLAENAATQEGLLKQCGVKTVKELYNYIGMLLWESRLLYPGKYRDNISALNYARATFKDEARAYNIGGKSLQEFYKLVGTNIEGKATKSEMRALMCNETIKVINKARKLIYKNRIKAFFGLKTNVEKEQKIFDAVNHRLNRYNELVEKYSKEVISEYETRPEELTQEEFVKLVQQRVTAAMKECK